MTSVSIANSTPWRRALRHLAWAVFAVVAIAISVNLLALPVAHAQARAAWQCGKKIANTSFKQKLMPKPIKVMEAAAANLV